MEGKTLEELRALIVRDAGWFPVCIPLVEERLTKLIAAAEAVGIEKGRVEGAEKERMRLWMERDHIPQDANERCVLIPVRAFCPTPKESVLAPKEKPKIGKETCKTYSESWCKGQDCRVCQFNIPGMGPAEAKPIEAIEAISFEGIAAYKKMVAKMVYWKGRYEMAVRGMTDKDTIEIMGREP